MNEMQAVPSGWSCAGGNSPGVGLRLFVAGVSPRSRNAIETLKRVCQEHRELGCQVEVIDIYQQPELARQNQVVATPTLVRYLPSPKKILVGDFSQPDRLLACLGVAPT